MRWRGLATVVGMVAVLFAAAGCEIDATVAVRIDDLRSGAGTVSLTVRLDEEAVRRAELGGGTLDGRILVSDLVRSGWRTNGWTRDGGAAIAFEREFDGPADLADRIAELTGDTELLGEARVVRERGVLRSRDGLGVRADLRELAPGATSDAELRARFDAAGLDLDEVEEVLAATLVDALTLAVSVAVPGASDVVVVHPGEDATAAVVTSTFHRDRAVNLVAAGGLALGAIALLATAATARRRDRRRGDGRTGGPDRGPGRHGAREA